jgi:hypothetical protein
VTGVPGADAGERKRRLLRSLARAVSPRVAGLWASYERDLATARRRVTPPAERADLCALAARFKTDKWGTHRYAQHYETHLRHLRDRPITLLEIGVGGYAHPSRGGASLRMWKAYFPKAHVVGMDVHDKSALAEPRIDIVRADQSDADSLADVNRRFGPFDVIVDDGSHVSAHVRTTFETLFPLLAADGVYAIEDLQTSYWPEYGGAVDLGDGTTSMALVKSLVDGLNYEEHLSTVEPSYTDTHVVAVHCYHNLVVVQKGRNAEGTLKRALLKDRYLTG